LGKITFTTEIVMFPSNFKRLHPYPGQLFYGNYHKLKRALHLCCE
jgi:hypothetical protein